MSAALVRRTNRWGGVRSSLVAVAISGLGLAACGGGGGTSSATTSTTAKSAAGATTPTSTHTSAAAAPGASGTLAAISGSTLEVQNPTSGQVSVVVTKSTTITQTVKESLSQVIVGSCVSAIGKPAKSGTTTGPVAATSVTISKATSSGCTRAGAFAGGPGGAGGFAGFAGGAGGRTTGSTFHRPTTSGSFPKGRGRADFSSAFGKVTSVSKTGFALDVTEGTTKGSRTVDVTSSTTYSETAPATSSDLKVGQCVVAFGSTNTMGTVTAKTLSVSTAGSGGCSSGFGAGGAGFPGAGGFSGGAGGGSSSSDGSTGAASA